MLVADSSWSLRTWEHSCWLLCIEWKESPKRQHIGKHDLFPQHGRCQPCSQGATWACSGAPSNLGWCKYAIPPERTIVCSEDGNSVCKGWILTQRLRIPPSLRNAMSTKSPKSPSKTPQYFTVPPFPCAPSAFCSFQVHGIPPHEYGFLSSDVLVHWLLNKKFAHRIS